MIDGNRVVISGISGMYPKSKNVTEFSKILYNQINPVTPLKDSISFKHPELPIYKGEIPNLDTFDAQFFKINYRLSRSVDPMARKLLENTYQALFDAGVSTECISNKKVGVFVGSSIGELEKSSFYSTKSITGLNLLGSSKTMFANRISYWLNTTGPSFTIDAESCSSMSALDQAWKAIVNGDCEAAIVAGCHVIYHPQTIIIKGRSIKLTMGHTQSFDQNADGCVISDAINVFFLQKAKDALRIYAEVEYVKCIFSPLYDEKDQCHKKSAARISKFLGSFYKEADISPNLVEFVEAFGIAEPAFDKAELEAIDEIFCENRKQPLLVGSVTSNIGHTDAASALTAITKVLLAYHDGTVAANLHYKESHSDVSAIDQGRLRVITKHEPFKRTYAAVNNFSFVGAMGHVLLQGHFKPKDINRYKSSIQHLVLVSARNESAVKKIFNYLSSKPLDPEEIALLHKFYRYNMSGHLGRGYIIIDALETECVCIDERLSYFNHQERPLWFVYSGMGSQWAGMGVQLMTIPIFAAAIERCRSALEPKGIDIVHIITTPDKNIFNNILHSFVGIAAIQIGLTDVLREIGIVPDAIIGHSAGELGCGYADGCLTAEEMILSAYSRGLVSLQTSFIKGSMAAVGIGYQKMTKMLPPEIEIACRNGPESCTISGPHKAVEELVQELTAKSIFAKEVSCSNIAFHSRYISHACSDLLKQMYEVIKSPKVRSSRWVSTSVPQSKWGEPVGKYSSPEYYTNNLLNPVLFEETMHLIPQNAVLIEIAPHGLLQAILKRSLPSSCLNISLTNRGTSDSIRLVLEAIGKLYEIGRNPDIAVLYPEVEFPVSTQTPMLSHLVQWAHEEVWPVPIFKSAEIVTAPACNFIISTCDDEYKYLEGYIQRDQNVFPFSAALVCVWDTLAMVLNIPKKKLSVEFRDVHLYSQPIIPENSTIHIKTSLQRGCGRFEVLKEESNIATGYISYEKVETKNILPDNNIVNENLGLDSTTVYQILCEKNLIYRNDFKSIHSVNKTLDVAKLVWDKNWVTFIDGLIQLNILRQRQKNVEPRLCFIRSMIIDINLHEESAGRFGNQLPARILNEGTSTSCGGVSIKMMKFHNVPLLTPSSEILPKTTYKTSDYRKNKSNLKNDDIILSGSLGNNDSLRWEYVPKLQGPDIDVKVCYAAINQHDFKIAAGTIPVFEKETNDKSYGMDFSGVTASGKRVMGLVESGAVRSQVRVRPELLWPVPDHWSLEDAATVPLPYSLALYCLVVKYKLYNGTSILIHGGDAPLGQAVISIALAHDCEVFATVSNINKKKLLKRLFSKLKMENIGSARDTSFRNMVLKATKGNGCNIVLSCIKENKDVSFNCCKLLGVVMDTSLVSNHENYTLRLGILKLGKSVVAVNLFSIFENREVTEMQTIQAALSKGIACGYVRPLTRVIYEPQEVPRAFAILSGSHHCGRVLINLQQSRAIMSQKIRIQCNPDLWSVLIFEDMTFGSLLADRLVQRGSKKLLIYCPRLSVYFNYKIQLLQEEGVKVEFENYNSPNLLSNMTNKLFDTGVEGVYIIRNKEQSENLIALNMEHFALMLKNIRQSLTYSAVIIINSEERNCSTDTSLSSSAITTINVPKTNSISLHDIVNGIEKAICTQGSVIDMYIQQRQKKTLIQEVANIIGTVTPVDVDKGASIFNVFNDIDKSVAISTYLRDAYNIYIPEEKIPLLKIQRLYEMDQILNRRNDDIPKGLENFFSYKQSDELNASINLKLLPTLTQKILAFENEIDVNKNCLFIIPGIEGYVSRFEEICERLKIAAVFLQPTFDQSFMTETEYAQHLAKILLDKIKIDDNFYLLGYEYGVPIALEVAAILEDNGLKGTVFCIGHTLDDLRAEVVKVLSEFKSEAEVQEAVMHEIIRQLTGVEIKLPKSNTPMDWKQRLEYVIQSRLVHIPHSTQYLLEIIESTYNRLMRASNVVVTPKSLRSQLVLIKAHTTTPFDSSISSFQCHSQMPLAVYDLRTPLSVIAKDPRCPTIINRHLSLEIQKAYDEKNICEIYIGLDHGLKED